MPPQPRTLGELVRSLQAGRDPFAAAQAGAHGAATSPWNRLKQPTKAMEKAGNYTMGVAHWQGLRLHIENPAHTVREGVGEDGKAWRNVMQAHYGYIAGTRGADGDGLDVFLGPYPEGREVWVLNQTDAAGAFDEHKVMVGFVDERAAIDAYRLSYTPGWDRYRPPIRLSPMQLRWWLKYGDTTRELTPDHVPPETDMDEPNPTNLTRVLWDSAAMPASGLTLGDVLYGIRVDDASDGLLMDAMTMADLVEGAELELMDALVTMAGKLKPKMDALLRIMEAAGGDVKPLALQISDPMRRYGGAHVAVLFELSDGQTVTIWFHNPDSTPAKLSPADDLVSWKWMLNKKDITIVVAPESGQDLNLREVARRIMRLAAKNSAAFARANKRRADTMAEIQGLKDTLTAKQGELAGIHRQIEVARVEAEGRSAENDRRNAENEARSIAEKQKRMELAAASVAAWRAGNSDESFRLYTEQEFAENTDRGEFELLMAKMYGALPAAEVPDGGSTGGDPNPEPKPDGGAWTLPIVSPEGLQALVESRGIAAEVWGTHPYASGTAVDGATLSVGEVKASLEWRHGRSYSLRSIGDRDGEFDVSGTVLSDMLDQFAAWAKKPEPAAVAPAPAAEPPENVFADIDPEAFGLLTFNPNAYWAAFEVEKSVTKRGGTVSWVIATREPAMPVLDSAGARVRLTLDSLFERDGSRFVRGDIAYSGKPVGAATVNGKGETFFEAADGGAFNVYAEDDDKGLKDAVDEGLAGWVVGQRIPDVLDVMLSMEVTDAIDEEVRSRVNAAENAADDAESDGGAPAGTILDRDNAHWKRLLTDAASEGRGGKTALLGVLHKGGRRLTVNVVRKKTNRADWYVVLSEPGKSKVKESIPFPAMRGNMKLLLAAGYLMGYLDADESSGWRIAPPGVDVPAEENDRNPVLAHAQAVRSELVKLGYAVSSGGATMMLERDGAMHVLKWDYEGPDDAPTGTVFRVAKLVNGAQVDDIEFPDIQSSRPEVVAAQLDSYVRGMNAGPDPEPEPEPEPPAPTETAEAKFLREVKAGAHDAAALGDLLARIEAAVQALSDAGQLTGELDADAAAAINRWVELDQKANG